MELFEAFLFLDRARPVSFGFALIPLTEMTAYASVFGYQRVADFVTVMRALDEVVCAHHASKSDNGKT